MKNKTLFAVLSASLLLTACKGEPKAPASTPEVTASTIVEAEKSAEAVTASEQTLPPETKPQETKPPETAEADETLDWAKGFAEETRIPAQGEVNYDHKNRQMKSLLWGCQIIDGVHSLRYYIINHALIDYVGGQAFDEWTDKIHAANNKAVADFLKAHDFEGWCKEHKLDPKDDGEKWASREHFLSEMIPIYGLDFHAYSVRDFCDDFGITREIFQKIIDEDKIGYLQYAYNLDEIFPETAQ
jgi:hypothetical protein